MVALLVRAQRLVMLTSTEGIYRDPSDPSTLIEEVYGDTVDEINAKIDETLQYCKGASRTGANGAAAKLQFARRPLEAGISVIIAGAQHHLRHILNGKVRCTRLRLNGISHE